MDRNERKAYWAKFFEKFTPEEMADSELSKCIQYVNEKY